jgi:hypothetical protein
MLKRLLDKCPGNAAPVAVLMLGCALLYQCSHTANKTRATTPVPSSLQQGSSQIRAGHPASRQPPVESQVNYAPQNSRTRSCLKNIILYLKMLLPQFFWCHEDREESKAFHSIPAKHPKAHI